MGVEHGFRRRAQRLAGLLVVGEARRHRRERDREIGAIAGAHAHGAEGAGLRSEIGRRHALRIVRIIAAEQIAQEVAAALLLRRRRILRAAIVLRQRRQHRAALSVAFRAEAARAATAQALEIAGDLVQIGAHLLDLGVDRAALRRLAAEQREEAGGIAAHALGLHGDAVELGLLAGLGILVAADLLLARGVASAAAIQRGELALQAHAHRIRPDAVLARLRRRSGRTGLRESTGDEHGRAQQHGAGKETASTGGRQEFRHIRHSSEVTAQCDFPRDFPTELGGPKRALQ